MASTLFSWKGARTEGYILPEWDSSLCPTRRPPTASERADQEEGLIAGQVQAAAAILDRVAHLWITKYHLLLNTRQTVITGCPVVMGASPGGPGETGMHKASGCSLTTKTGLILLKTFNKDIFSPVTVSRSISNTIKNTSLFQVGLS